MTLKIELPPETEQRLKDAAAQQGVPLHAYVTQALEALVSAPASPPARKPYWQRMVDAGERIPKEDLDRAPDDGAENLDHYLYGMLKEHP